jgi:hypothetical protein
LLYWSDAKRSNAGRHKNAGRKEAFTALNGEGFVVDGNCMAD